MNVLRLSTFMRSTVLILRYKFIFVVSIFVVLILGNQVPVYPFDNDTNHGTQVSVQNEKKDNIEYDESSRSFAEQIVAYCEDGNEHCLMVSLDELNKTASRQDVLKTFSDLNLLYDKREYECHDVGHHLGSWLYNYTKDLKVALNYSTLFCGGSNYHGIFQGYF